MASPASRSSAEPTAPAPIWASPTTPQPACPESAGPATQAAKALDDHFADAPADRRLDRLRASGAIPKRPQGADVQQETEGKPDEQLHGGRAEALSGVAQF